MSIKKGRSVERSNLFDASVTTTPVPNSLVQTNSTGKISDALLNTTSSSQPNKVLYTNSSGGLDHLVIRNSVNVVKNYYVNQVSGSDSNDGSSAAPFATLGKAFSMGGCLETQINIHLQSNYTMSTTTEQVTYIPYGRYYLNLYDKTLTAGVYLSSHPSYNAVTTFRPDGYVMLGINFGTTGKIVIPSSTLPLRPDAYSLFGIRIFGESYLTVFLYMAGSNSGTEAVSISSGSLIGVHHWDNTVYAHLHVGMYPHYNRIINLYGTNTYLVNFAGRAGGSLGVQILNNTSGSFIKRNSSNISVANAIAGVNYSSGIPVNITMAT